MTLDNYSNYIQFIQLVMQVQANIWITRYKSICNTNQQSFHQPYKYSRIIMTSSPKNKAHSLPISPSSSSLFPSPSSLNNHNNNNHISADQQQSQSLDPQQQLRSLLTIVQQYKQHYTQLYQQNKDTIYKCASFEQFINRVKQKSQVQVQSLYDGMKSMRKMLQDIFHQFGTVVPEIIKQLSDWHTKSQKLVDQVFDQLLIIQNLKQRQAQSQKSLNQITVLYENTRHANMELNDRINIKQMEYESQSREIRKTFLEVTESNQMQKKILQQMYESNEKLTTSLLQSKKQKSQLQKDFQLLSDQLSKSAHRIHLLQQQLQKKDSKIRQCEAEMQSIHNSRRKKSTQSMASNGVNSEDDGYNRTSFIEVGQDKKVDKTKLGQQLNGYKMPTIKDLQGSFIMGTGVKRSVDAQESDYVTQYEQQQKANKSNVNMSIAEQQQTKMQQCKPSKPKPRQVTDPYFSHYILISQSVKIRQDCQDMLNIDMKPYYQEIIQKRVPMHLWDQWVKNRLRELMRQRYPAQ